MRWFLNGAVFLGVVALLETGRANGVGEFLKGIKLLEQEIMKRFLSEDAILPSTRSGENDRT